MQKQQLDTLLFDLLRQRQAQNTSSQESASIEQLEEIKGNLEQLISRLAISTPQLTPPKTAPFTYQNPTPSENLSSSQLPTAADGRYRLSNNSLALDLHIDRKKCGIITGDLYATVLDFRGESNAYIGSFRSKRGANLTSWEPSLPITAYDADGQSASGTLTFTLVAGKELALQLSLETKIRNLPVDQPITFSGRILSNKSREISIEMEQEVGCQPIEGHSSSGEKYSIKRCLEQAGFEVSQYGRNLAIPTPPLGNWDSGQLHNLHLQLSKDAEERHPLHFNAILLKHHSKPGVVAEQLLTIDPQRPCCEERYISLFEEGMGGLSHPNAPLQHSLHAIGKSFGLRTCADEARLDSPSFMNLEWQYAGGNNADSFWRNFDLSFDAEELTFLRHAPQHLLSPMRESDLNAHYWEELENTSHPPLIALESQNYRLNLLLPKNGAVFRLGQPLLLGVSLTNASGRTQTLPRFLLDPKAGYLTLTIQRDTLYGTNAPYRFRPLIQRTYNYSIADKAIIAPEGVMEDNLNLTYGIDGFPFSQPGIYSITATLNLYQGRRVVKISAPTLKIAISSPHSIEEENDCLLLLEPEVGMYIALGGTTAFAGASEKVAGIIERRQRRGRPVEDPVVAGLLRCQAIQALRDDCIYQNGRFDFSNPSIEQAQQIIQWLGPIGPKVFDPVTDKQMHSLIAKGRERISIP